MDITVIANHPAITSIVLNTEVFADDEADTLYFSNPLDTPIPVTFWNPDGLPLTFHGEPLESLQLPPKSLAKLTVAEGDISVEKQEGGEVVPIPMVPAIELNPTNWWNFSVDRSKFDGKFKLKQARELYATELKKLQNL